MIEPNIIKKEAKDSTFLRVAFFEPKIKPLGVIQIIHGFGEGIEHYAEFGDFFAKNGFVCAIHDQRGFGKMPDISIKEKKAARGIIPRYESFLEDAQTIRNEIIKLYPDIPVTLFGFSMGGNIAINHLLENSQDQYDKLILASPWLRLYRPKPKFVDGLAKIIGSATGRLKTLTNTDVNNITRNPERLQEILTNEIFHNRISIRMYSGVLQRGEHAIRNIKHVTIPTLVLAPGQDRIVCPKAVIELYENMGENARLEVYPEAYHSLHDDIINQEVFSVILDFCSQPKVKSL